MQWVAAGHKAHFITKKKYIILGENVYEDSMKAVAEFRASYKNPNSHTRTKKPYSYDSAHALLFLDSIFTSSTSNVF